MNDFVSENSGFIITVLGMLGAAGAGVLFCLLKSRCETIRCGCISCERDVIPAEQGLGTMRPHANSEPR